MIVKNLLVVGVVAGFASAALAEDAKGSWSVSGRVRVDAEQSTKEEKPAVGDKTTTKESTVSLNRAQFTLSGSRGSDSVGITYYADNNELYSAVVSHKFSDMVTAHFGKMKVLALGVENSYDEIDHYLMSLAGEHAPMNSTGARIDLGFGDHNISIQAVEGVSGTFGEEEEITDGGTQTPTISFGKSGGLTTALQYRGEINKMIKPVVTYTQVRPTSSKGTVDRLVGDDSTANYGDGFMTQIGVGAQVSTAGAVIDLEYDTVKMHKQKGVTGAAAATNKDADMSSLVAQVKYTVGSSTPFLKLTSDTMKKGQEKDEGDMTGMNLALGVEHALDSSCRLHAVYTSMAKSTKSNSKDDKETTAGFNFGVTASM
jgi:hypothetical protein